MCSTNFRKRTSSKLAFVMQSSMRTSMRACIVVKSFTESSTRPCNLSACVTVEVSSLLMLLEIAEISSAKSYCIISFALRSSLSVVESTFKWLWRVSKAREKSPNCSGNRSSGAMPTRNSLKLASNFPEI